MWYSYHIRKEHKHEKDNKAGEMNISFSATEHVLRA